METLLKKYCLDAYLNITSDEHLNEYIGDSDQRIKYLTGFTGSNGLAVTCKKNVFYTDSRYYIQAHKELKNYCLLKTQEKPLEDFLFEMEISRVGLNPRHFSYKYVNNLKNSLKKYKIEIIFVDEDFVEKLYPLPKREFKKIYSIENLKILDFYKKNKIPYEKLLYNEINENSLVVGKTCEEKIKEIRGFFKDDEEMIITELDTISWIFNLRGSDISYNPVFYSYASITQKEIKLFVNYQINLPDDITICKYNLFEEYVRNINKSVVISGSCNSLIDSLLTKKRFTTEIRDLQSVKTKEQLEGFNLAYILDGIALCKLFKHIEDNVIKDSSSSDICKNLTELNISENNTKETLSTDIKKINKLNGLTEIEISDMLLKIKSNFYGFKYPSFESIVGYQKNSAIVHYSAGHEIIKNGVVLLDIGSNYIFGTTDTSRTLFLGNPTEEFKRYYTIILKGQLRVLSQTFSLNTNGCILDFLTRMDLLNIKQNYGHASGHGVGHFLCVHENPPTLSPQFNQVLKINQVFSIEPGIYFEDKWGIRLENLVFTESVDETFLKLRDITYVPYQLNLIDMNMLNEDEIKFLNKLNKEIYDKLIDVVDCKEYLEKNTKFIDK